MVLRYQPPRAISGGPALNANTILQGKYNFSNNGNTLLQIIQIKLHHLANDANMFAKNAKMFLQIMQYIFANIFLHYLFCKYIFALSFLQIYFCIIYRGGRNSGCVYRGGRNCLWGRAEEWIGHLGGPDINVWYIFLQKYKYFCKNINIFALFIGAGDIMM